MASLGARRLLPSLVSRRLSPFPRAFPRLPTGAAPLSSDEPPPPPRSGPSDPSGTAAGEGPHGAHRNRRSGGAGDYEEEQGRVLRAALSHVLKLGWSESAMIAGAKDAGVSPSIVGAFPRKEAALVEFFMDDCLQRLIDRIDSGEELKDLILSERLSKLIRRRLEMQAPYISRWPQALSIQAQPANLPTSFKQRAMLVDEFWHAAGDTGLDIDWYVKRTVLGGIYSTSEVYMITDHSPEFRDTWMFVDNRIKDAFDLQKTVLEAAYLAEAVGAGVGNSMQGFMRKIFHQ
ncbi:ubiquinone biosynthesis protein COQ9, mitochondrial-like [Ananas comosus]|uniref:Ubiquinone biosynthesis protein n=2 Tax=Ananas comosus TaxID=4615 RepID=A0A6P5G9S1_ANACO|nr:ubiquinone biosynthesis protein COQ9, mitochondrial-like [Ananas comosus]CAD1838037.1 unnamed protein product [Ananas comosus var. bracteatus]